MVLVLIHFKLVFLDGTSILTGTWDVGWVLTVVTEFYRIVFIFFFFYFIS